MVAVVVVKAGEFVRVYVYSSGSRGELKVVCATLEATRDRGTQSNRESRSRRVCLISRSLRRRGFQFKQLFVACLLTDSRVRIKNILY